MKNYIVKLSRKKYYNQFHRTIKEKIGRNIIYLGMLITLLLTVSINSSLVNAEPEFPKATASKYANDYVGVIDADSAQYIMSVGKELEDKTGAQAVVVVIDSLKGETIESYANGIFRNWGIGQKDKNNGLLILLSIKDQIWRVEVGTGLEGAITDIYSSRVMNDFAVPKFKQNQYGQGLRSVYSILSDNIAKEYGVTLEKNINVPQYNESSKKLNTSNRGNGILVIGVIVLIILDFIFNRGRLTRFMIKILFWSAILRRGGRGGRGGGGLGGFGGGSSSGGGSSGRW